MQNFLILGLGASGVSVIKLLCSQNKTLFAYDDNFDLIAELKSAKLIPNSLTQLKKLNKETLKNIDCVIISPGFRLSKKLKQLLKKQEIPVQSEVDYASIFSPAPIYGITGTNGKTTTATFLHDIFLSAGENSHCLGNVGTPFSSQVDKITPEDKVVLEVSSFALEHFTSIQFSAVALLNLAPDHLDRYRDFDEYKMTKSRIFDYTNRVKLANYDDENVREIAKGKENITYFSTKPLPQNVNGYFLDKNKIFQNLNKEKTEILSLPNLDLVGEHNYSNLLCALALALNAGITPAKIKKALSRLSTPRHRLEFVASVNGAKYYNDSKATNIHATLSALKCFTASVHLLVGGSEKGENYGELISLLPKNVVSLVCFGKAGKTIFSKSKKLHKNSSYHKTLVHAFDFVRMVAGEGDIVLLSPACASFDEFTDYKARGDYFVKLVKESLGEA